MNRRKTTRRDFLRGKSALRAVSDLVPDAPETPEASSAAESGQQDESTPKEQGSYLVQVGRTAMACEFDVFLNAGQHAHATEAALEAMDLVDQLEDQMTIYREHSDMSGINRRAASEAVRVETNLMSLLELAVSLHDQTSGAFDITSGPVARLWGVHRRSGQIPSGGEIKEELQRVGSRMLELDMDASTIRFLRPDMDVNLNALGKGYALDRCGDLLDARGVSDFLIHGGQSSMLARGSRLSGDTTRGWQVAVRHPLISGERLAKVWLRDRALGTSGSANQFFHYKGRRFGHVVDPRSGMSVEGVLSATVLAPSAVFADALSTAFFVLGVEPTFDYCERHPELAVILVCPGRRKGTLALHTKGLEEADWERLTD